MQIERKKRTDILLLVLGGLGVITLLFFAGEKLLFDGWCYIPGRAIAIALGLCLFWQGILIIGGFLLSKQIKIHFSGWVKSITMIMTAIVVIALVLFLAWNWVLYSLKFDEKVEQYDEHIALYVSDTFVRTRFRYPHYMYEENWLFMRKLSDGELDEAVRKYGDPDKYYN